MRYERLFNDAWDFIEMSLSDTSIDKACSSTNWQRVDLPHDWLIYDSNDLYREGVGWYRRIYKHEIHPGRKTYICFDGVYMDSCLYINTMQVGEWKYGYTGFAFDLTDFLVDGENEILLSCTYRAPNSRWYTGAGIYRNVRLIDVDEHHIDLDGIYVSSRPYGDAFHVEIETQLSKSGGVVTHAIYDPEGCLVTCGTGGKNQTLTLSNPHLWSPVAPYLYTLKTELILEGQTVDRVSQKIGLRTVRFDPNEGFFLNEQRMKIKGICQHHDLGCLGAAFNINALKRQLLLLIDMGANAIRCAHSPMAPEFLDLCDELGLLVMSEFLDSWEKPKTPYDYARFFPDWARKDAESWIKRDRNHPSVIMWSVGNEISDMHKGPRGLEILELLISLVKHFDPNENAHITFCSNYMPWENTQKCADLIKLVGYNYSEKYYAAHHEAHPDWIIFGGETGSLAQSRGIYHFPFSVPILADDDSQCSALGNSRTSWGAKSTEQCIINDRDSEFSPGQFIWSGWDYLGEPTPYHSKCSFLGHIDTAGFPKDSFYLFRSEWTDYKISPTVHLFPYWDFNDGQLIDVMACSNAPRVELFVNGFSQGVKNIDHLHGTSLLGHWLIPYAKGYIEAVAYDDFGNVIASSRRSSFTDAAAISLSPDKTELSADGRDLIFVTVSMVDANGNPVDNANNRVQVSVLGAARLVGLDNGNSADFESFKGTSMRLFSGKLLVVIAAKKASGDITVTVSSAGMSDASLHLTAIPSGIQVGVSADEENIPRGILPEKEIPVRKIGLSADRPVLDADHPSSVVTYSLFPADTTYKEVEWRLTDASGIDSPLAVLEETDTGVRITARRDGEFYLRCATKNGSDSVYLYSLLSFTAHGLGAALPDPYEYVSGGLYTLSGGGIGNGNERGFATSRDGESYAGFENLDFGSFGSDQITLDVFCLDSDPLEIRIWEGIPDGKDSQLLKVAVYQKASVWNTYQAETFLLEKRLSGIKTLSFQLSRKAHIKGFRFMPREKAFCRLFAGECDSVNGDRFLRTSREITSIGNNVSIVFKSMDFGIKGANKLILSGRTDLNKNTIQIRFHSTKDDTDSIQIAEFSGQNSDQYNQQEFSLECVTGKQEVTFIFLPGSRFDFESFQFL